MANILYPSGALNLLNGNFHFCNYGPTGSAVLPASSSYAVLTTNGFSTTSDPAWNWYCAVDETYDDMVNQQGACGAVPPGAYPSSMVTASAPVLLTNITCSAPPIGAGTGVGCLDADDVVFTAVPLSYAGEVITGVVIYQSSSVAGTDYLYANYSTGSGGPIAITPNGGDITVTWASTGIMCLSGGC